MYPLALWGFEFVPQKRQTSKTYRKVNSGVEVHCILAQSHIPAFPGLAPGLAHKGQRKEESAKD